MAINFRIFVCLPLLFGLSACNALSSGQQAADESAQQIANRAAAISAAADATVNQQVSEIEAAANAAEPNAGNTPSR
jgi:hypothetical protein